MEEYNRVRFDKVEPQKDLSEGERILAVLSEQGEEERAESRWGEKDCEA